MNEEEIKKEFDAMVDLMKKAGITAFGEESINIFYGFYFAGWKAHERFIEPKA